VAGNDRFQIECSEFLQHHSPDSCIGVIEMIAPVAHGNFVGTRSDVANWRFSHWHFLARSAAITASYDWLYLSAAAQLRAISATIASRLACLDAANSHSNLYET
jgi:hypothetical protein